MRPWKPHPVGTSPALALPARDTHPTAKRAIPRRLLALGAGVLLPALAALLLWGGFCWGGWFASSAFVQQLLQCRCPASSEQVRYHPFIVLAPACRKPQVSAVSDDGRWLIYSERPPQGRIMLVDLETQHMQPLNLKPAQTGEIRFITPTLLIVSLPWRDLIPTYGLYDTTTNRLSPVPTVDLWQAWQRAERRAILVRARSAR